MSNELKKENYEIGERCFEHNNMIERYDERGILIGLYCHGCVIFNQGFKTGKESMSDKEAVMIATELHKQDWVEEGRQLEREFHQKIEKEASERIASTAEEIAHLKKFGLDEQQKKFDLMDRFGQESKKGVSDADLRQEIIDLHSEVAHLQNELAGQESYENEHKLQWRIPDKAIVRSYQAFRGEIRYDKI
jgi:hypothetical protein